MATIYQVSELAGVSLATVSRVVNKNARVSDKTKAKVVAAMEELGYRPNSIAQSLASNRSSSFNLALLLPHFNTVIELMSTQKAHQFICETRTVMSDLNSVSIGEDFLSKAPYSKAKAANTLGDFPHNLAGSNSCPYFRR